MPGKPGITSEISTYLTVICTVEMPTTMNPNPWRMLSKGTTWHAPKVSLPTCLDLPIASVAVWIIEVRVWSSAEQMVLMGSKCPTPRQFQTPCAMVTWLTLHDTTSLFYNLPSQKHITIIDEKQRIKDT